MHNPKIKHAVTNYKISNTYLRHVKTSIIKTCNEILNKKDKNNLKMFRLNKNVLDH